ncbi:unnamed protein product [Arctogadus glacialis]
MSDGCACHHVTSNSYEWDEARWNANNQVLSPPYQRLSAMWTWALEPRGNQDCDYSPYAYTVPGSLLPSFTPLLLLQHCSEISHLESH